jgi:hypothetical protein
MRRDTMFWIGLGFGVALCVIVGMVSYAEGKYQADRWWQSAVATGIYKRMEPMTVSPTWNSPQTYGKLECFEMDEATSEKKPIPCPLKAVTHGKNSPAVTGNGNSVVYRPNKKCTEGRKTDKGWIAGDCAEGEQ